MSLKEDTTVNQTSKPTQQEKDQLSGADTLLMLTMITTIMASAVIALIR